MIPVRDRMTDSMIEAAQCRACGRVVVGLYGYVARGLLYESMLPVDYVFDGFESCMSECLMGRDALLLCDEDCVDLIEQKIRRLQDFGTVVESLVLDRKNW